MHRAGAALLAIAMLSLATAAGAEGDPAPTPGWEFAFEPCFWGAGLEGTIEADGVESDLDVDFSDIVDALDVGVLGVFEARRGRASLATNVVYLRLSEDASGPIGPLLPPAPPGSFEVDALSETVLVEGMAGYEVLSIPLADGGGERRIAVDLRGGFRIWWLRTDLDIALRPGVPLPAFQRSFDDATQWIDPLLGVRVRADLTDQLGVLGDYGGFDVGSSSHRTWSLAAVFRYEASEHWHLGAGWRSLDLDRGPADIRMEGPLLGAAYRF
jgi:hypothetical protein